MKRFAVIGTASLFLLFATSAAFAAQEHPENDKPEKQESKPEAKPEAKPAAKPAAKQEPQDKTAKPENKQPVKEEGKPAQQQQQNKSVQQQNQQKTQQSKGNGAHGRISDEHYRASFGSGHNFHVNQGDYNNHRFNYGGYSFGFIDPWPVGWYYTDDVYVVYDGGGYYMYDVVHPGIRISVNIL
jgi:glucan-binding YG repeat protein